MAARTQRLGVPVGSLHGAEAQELVPSSAAFPGVLGMGSGAIVT